MTVDLLPGLARTGGAALPLTFLHRDGLAAWRATQPAATTAWLDAHRFDASPGSVLALPGPDGLAGALAGIGDWLDPYAYAHAPFSLPAGTWSVTGGWTDAARAALELGWALGAWRYDRFRKLPRMPAQLVVQGEGDAESADVARASLRVREWVSAPPDAMGPAELEAAARAIAEAHGAEFESIEGDALAEGFPSIHAVGRGSARAPRLLVLRWGDPSHPRVGLVGKGVCFDTGGLNIKPTDGMRNMKKDMGGAAHALALAGLVMARGLPVRLTLAIPAVENSIGPDAFRPGDVLATRKGISVEVDNTDAEGRLVLADALTYVGEDAPELLLDFATLTGAARIALGPDLPALFANDDALANDWIAAGDRTRDPVWRLPLWRPYLRYLTSNVADLANSGSRMGGAITAALYLERFVPAGIPWGHLDVYAWNDGERPGRPAGGEALALRSAYGLLKARYGA